MMIPFQQLKKIIRKSNKKELLYYQPIKNKRNKYIYIFKKKVTISLISNKVSIRSNFYI